MLVFSRRPVGYKAGLLLLLLSLIFYIIGFSSAYWTIYVMTFFSDYGMNLSYPYFTESVKGHNGLWETCDVTTGFTIKMCSPVSHLHVHAAWVSAVQGLQCIGLLGLIVACGYAAVINLVQRSPNINNRHLEMLAIVSGVIGFIGSIIYAAESSGNENILMSETNMYWDVELYEEQNKFTLDKNDLGWSYCLNLVGCLLSLVSAVVICAYNRLIAPDQHDVTQSPTVAVSFSAAGVSTGGQLEFVPPQHLAGGIRPPENLPRPSAEV